jgi:hypothetical protein
MVMKYLDATAPVAAGSEIASACVFQQTVAAARAMSDRSAMLTETRRRLRGLVELVDEVIADCERAHLDRQVLVSEQLSVAAERVYAEALRLRSSAGIDLLGVPPESGPERIHELMDRLWQVQEGAMDSLAPPRRTLLDGDL